MAARRLKMEGGPGRKERRPAYRNPIPSFSEPAPSSIAASVGKNKNESAASTTSKFWSHPELNEDELFRMDSALQMHFSVKNPTLVPFDEVYVLMKTLDPPISSSTRRGGGGGGGNQVDSELSVSERQLVYLLCVTVPVLYKISPTAAGGSSKWCVENVPAPAGQNRSTLFRNLCRRETLQMSVKEDICNAVRANRAAAKPFPSASTRQQQSSIVAQFVGKSAIDPSISVEERVRARALARQKAETSAAAAAKPDDNRAWLVRLADALWQHSNDVLSRQHNALGSGTSLHPKLSTVCTLTLHDAVVFLQRKVVGSQRRALAKAIVELNRLVPSWLTLSSGGQMSKDATIWIRSDEFAAARALLAGQPAPVPRATLKRPPSERQGLKRPPPAGDDEHGRKRAPESASYSATGAITDEPPQPSNRNLFGTEKKRSVLDASLNVETKPVVAKKPKKSPLRVNPHLILTDADYKGGEKIYPLTYESPRGLKTMLDQLNAGKRI